ncbi:MAG TPA: chemotaxis protein CheB [Rhodanobacteraceae bacterium]
MVESRTGPAVALLFADDALGGQLRDALVAFGARIVHEGAAGEVSRDTLAASGAEVVVVNLEPDEEAGLDKLYAALDGGAYRVVFNDADASRDLSGWDRARWARHLAAKLLGSRDVDPPRPADVPEPASVPVAAVAEADETQIQGDQVQADAIAATPVDVVADDAKEPVGDDALTSPVAAASEDEAELDAWTLESTASVPALSASEDDSAATDEATASMAAELEALLAANTDDAASSPAEPAGPTEDALTLHEAASAPAAEIAAEAPDAAQPPSTVEVQSRQHVDAPSPIADWELVDMTDAPAAAPPKPAPTEFGIHKVDAADFLKPQAAADESPVEPGLRLELVSLEESLAPTMTDEPVSEMLLDEGRGGIRRVVAVCAGQDGTAHVGAFLAGLPAMLPALVLVIQHQHLQNAETLAAALDAATRLPVSVASDGDVVRQGSVCLIPAGHGCEVERGGRVLLPVLTDNQLGDPSIDECLGLLARNLGADVTAVILAGASRDALAGAQEVHDHGGQVWIQDPAAGAGSMVAAIQAEGLASAVGTPTQLAQRLSEALA